MRTRLLFFVLLLGSVVACTATPTSPPVSRTPASPLMDADSSGAATGGGGQQGSGSGG
jgi:hypothetical protein